MANALRLQVLYDIFVLSASLYPMILYGRQASHTLKEDVISGSIHSIRSVQPHSGQQGHSNLWTQSPRNKVAAKHRSYT